MIAPIILGSASKMGIKRVVDYCDGWIPIFFSPDAFEETWGEHLEAGFAKVFF